MKIQSFNKSKLLEFESVLVSDDCIISNCEIEKDTIINGGCKLTNCEIGKNCVIENGCYLENCEIEDNAVIQHNCVLKNVKIGDNATLISSNVVNSDIGSACSVGPYARIRDNAKIGSNVRIGNFVEVKNSEIGDDTKVAHLTYIGDAVIGKKCNIGCGVVFVNYNGKIKQQTIVKDNSFIGCNCNLIAPVVIEKNTYICAGTTITNNVDEFDFVIGRNKQENKKDLAKKYLKEIVND